MNIQTLRRLLLAGLVAGLCLQPACADQKALDKALDLLGKMLDASRQEQNQPSQNPPAPARPAQTSPPQQNSSLRRGAEVMQFNYCSQFNRAQRGFAFALALIPDDIRRVRLPSANSDISSLYNMCAGQVRQHLCTQQTITFFGNFLYQGRPGSRVAGAASAAPKSAQAGVTGLEVLGAVAGAVTGAAVTGRPVTGGGLGGLAGYQAGSFAGDTLSLKQCRANVDAIGTTARQLVGRIRGYDWRYLGAYFDLNRRQRPALAQDIDYMRQAAERLKASGEKVF
ncbi:MAG TPA: hypothetical protein ENJ80_10745 [Gammaproteobacteria bacterium]|nr:hypothetical protein [Gammaproteobacteria bacterium]